MKMITLAVITGALILTGCKSEPTIKDCMRYQEIADTMMSAKQYGASTDQELLELAELSNDDRVITIAQQVVRARIFDTEFGKHAMVHTYKNGVMDRCRNSKHF